MHLCMRISEIANCQFEQFNFEPSAYLPYGCVSFVGKGTKERTVPVTERLRNTVLRYRKLLNQVAETEGQPAPNYFFLEKEGGKRGCHRNFIGNLLAEQIKFAKLQPFTPHKLRHTFGTILAENGASSYEIRDLMGHASIVTSECYVTLSKSRAYVTHLQAFSPKVAIAV